MTPRTKVSKVAYLAIVLDNSIRGRIRGRAHVSRKKHKRRLASPSVQSANLQTEIQTPFLCSFSFFWTQDKLGDRKTNLFILEAWPKWKMMENVKSPIKNSFALVATHELHQTNCRPVSLCTSKESASFESCVGVHGRHAAKVAHQCVCICMNTSSTNKPGRQQFSQAPCKWKCD